MNNAPVSTDQARLLAAAGVLRKHGWIDDAQIIERYKGVTKLCILEALGVVDGVHWYEVEAPPILAEVCREYGGNKLVKALEPALFELNIPTESLVPTEHLDAQTIWVYNDYICDGEETAIEVLEEAARRCGT